MSGILGIFGLRDLPSNSQVRRMLSAMCDRGDEVIGLWRAESAVLGAGRHRWECEDEFSGHVTVVEDEGLVVAADATLYYRDDLRRALSAAAVPVKTDNPSRLILAAYRAWGRDCVDHLEGDFAFVLFDRRTHEFFAARDPAGTRSLFHARFGNMVIVASSIGAILSHPQAAREIDLSGVGEAAAGLHSSSSNTTCYRNTYILPAAHEVHGRIGGTQVVRRYWRPRLGAGWGSAEDAAEELRDAICRAVSERLPQGGLSAVGLNGDWTSHAVFGAGQHVIRDRGWTPERLIAVSIPMGTGGRPEKGLAARWRTGVRWIDRDSALTLEDPALQYDPLVLGFESHASALTRGCRETGARVVLDGAGGNRVFVGSAIVLADHLARGQWFSLMRHRRIAGPGLKSLLRWAVPPSMGKLRSNRNGDRTSRHYLVDPVPPWIEPTFVARHDLIGRARYRATRPMGTGHAAYELLWSLTTPANGRLFSGIQSLGLTDGIEIRFPLFDRRLVDFIAARPLIERANPDLLLRRALGSLLPNGGPDPRPFRSSAPSPYVKRVLTFGIALVQEDPTQLTLVQAGIVHPNELTRAIWKYRRSGDHVLAVALYRTLQTELWLRSRFAPDESRQAERRKNGRPRPARVTRRAPAPRIQETVG